MKEKYQPSPGEMRDAEEHMTETQRAVSERRAGSIERLEKKGLYGYIMKDNLSDNERIYGEIDGEWVCIYENGEGLIGDYEISSPNELGEELYKVLSGYAVSKKEEMEGHFQIKEELREFKANEAIGRLLEKVR